MSFSQDKQDLKFLSTQRFTLLQLGIDMDAPKGKKLLKNHWKFFAIIGASLYMESAFVLFLIHNFSNIDVATRVMSLLNGGLLDFIKIIVFLAKADKLFNLIWDMNRLDKEADEQDYQIWLSENRICQMLGKIYLYCCMIAAFFATFIPIFFMVLDYIRNGEFNQMLIFDAKFPFDDGSVFIFVVNYLVCIIYMFTLLNITVAIDSLYGWYIFNISAHFRILRCKFQKVALKLENVDSRTFNHDFAIIVRYHIKTLDFVEDLSDIFGDILFFEVTFNCLQMCFSLYTLTNDQNIANMPFNFTVIVTVTLQLMIYCFGGQKIKNESSTLCSDIYILFPWHKLSVHQKKLILMSLMRSQKLSVFSGLFFEADNDLLVYILKTAYSFSALISFMKE